MADIKWIKIVTDMFDNRKIRQIECLPDGDSIIVIWMKLLCLAGQTNDNGMVYFTKDIPYTEQMLAQQFNRPLTTIQMALKTFEQFGMVELVDNILHISNWEKYQNIDGMEKIREQNRLRKQRQRERQKLLTDMSQDSHVTVTQGHATEEDKEEDIDKDIENNIHTATAARIDYQHYVDLYNSHCSSLPQVKTLNEKRKRLIKRVAKEISEDDLLTALNKANTNSFLRGDSGGWKANFDWLMNPDNTTKVLEGNYDRGKTQNSTNKDYDTDFGVVIEV